MNNKNVSLLRVLICPLLAFLIIAIPLQTVAIESQAQTTADDYAKGSRDAERYSDGSALWILGGFLCGVFAFGYVLLTTPQPPTVALVGKSSDYVLGYSEMYKRKVRGKNLLYSGIGWAAGIVIYFAFAAPSLSD